MKIKEKALNIIEAICNFMDKPYFALVLASIELFCYYLGLDLLIILTISLSISFALLFKKNLNCLLVIFLFMSSMISLKNSPATEAIEGHNPQYFFASSVYIPCIIAVIMPVGISIYLFVRNIIERKLPPKLFFVSIIALGFTLLTNGLMAVVYNRLNVVFGSFLFFFFVVLFIAVYPRIFVEKSSLKEVAKQVLIYCCVILIETFAFYLRKIIAGQEIYPRFDMIFLGWGNRNTIGMLLVVSLPFLFFLAKDEKSLFFKILSYIVGTLSLVALIVLFSRQSYLALGFLIGTYLLIEIFENNGKMRIKYIIYLSSCFLAILITFIVLFSIEYFNNITFDDLSDGRFGLWNAAIESFKENPIFGGGFYLVGGDPKINLTNIMPYLSHNTILQMIGSCGIVGFLAYCLYRFESIKEIYLNRKKEKIYPALALCVMILLSLIDIHIFDLLGSAIYVVLLAMCVSKKAEFDTKDIEKK